MSVTENYKETLPGALYLRSREKPETVALREKKLGIWQDITWREYWRGVAATALALRKLGFKKGEYAGILAENSREWVYGEMGIMLAGGVSLGLHPSTYDEELGELLGFQNIRILFCGDQEQVDKALRPPGDSLEHIIVFDSGGTLSYSDSRLLSWEKFLADGLALLDENGDAILQELLAGQDPQAPATAIFSSGTSDLPRGALFSQEKLLLIGQDFGEMYEIGPQDTTLSYLPLCHFIDKNLTIVQPLLFGLVPHIGESSETVMEDLREVSPRIFFSWPRFWKRLRLMTIFRMSHTSLIKEYFLDIFSNFTRDRVKFEWNRKKGLWRRFVEFLGDKLFYRALQNKFGLRKCRLAVSLGEDLGEETLYWHLGMGTPLAQAYGLAELGGAGFSSFAWDASPGASGRPFSRLEFRLAADSEVLVKGPYLCLGYYGPAGQEANNKLPLDETGWFHTGDYGFINQAHCLRLTGNNNTILKNHEGERFSIKRSEETMRECPYIREVVCFGENRTKVSALIEIDFERVADEINIPGIKLKNYQDLIQEEAVRELIGTEIKRQNEDLIAIEKVRDFGFFPEELDEDRGELSFSYAPRRRFIRRKYESLLKEIESS